MTLRTRLATLVLAAAFAAGPALALAGAGDTCCCPPAPCHDTAAGCEVGFTSASCCDAASAAVPAAAAKRSVDPPTTHAAPDRDFAALVAPLGTTRVAPDLAARVSSLRLSVVLRI